MCTGSKILLPCLLAGSASAIPAAAACWESVSQDYGIPVHVLKAIAKTESGFNAAARHRNSDGSYDIGLMQINSRWLGKLSAYGITESSLSDPCVNLKVGAWILSNNAKRLGWNWNAIGAYNVGCAKLDTAECAKRRNLYAWKVHAALGHAGEGGAMAAAGMQGAGTKRLVTVHLGTRSVEREGRQK